MNRTPPKQIREFLRKEVNYGCPVQSCGSPYLTWHHFDPPWAEKNHHNTRGMIALCAEHAAQADGGRFTKDQLVEMKKNPYVSLDKISDFYGYLRRNVVCIIGNIAYNVESVLEINGEKVISFRVDEEGYNRLNLMIRDSEGKPILTMEDNYWTAISRDIFDLSCSAQGKLLGIISKDKATNFFMRFDDYPVDVFKEKLIKNSEKILSTSAAQNRFLSAKEIREMSIRSLKSSIERLISAMGSPSSIPTWTIKGKILWGDVHIEIRDAEIEDLRGHNLFGGSFIVGRKAGFGFSNKRITIG